MKNKTFIKCSNCSGTDFKPTSIGEILATEGSFHVNAYACQKCGHIELFNPELDLYAGQKRLEYADNKRKEETERKEKEEARQKRIKELQEIINNEDMTVRQVNEAKKELELLREKKIDGVYVVGNCRNMRPSIADFNREITIIKRD
ncbi:MAG: hypothetical protein IJQ23_04465 [Clostridia bacterium]|nr:hypothetical protein [Clostridia bacterium]